MGEVVVSDLFPISKLTSSHPFQVICEEGGSKDVGIWVEGEGLKFEVYVCFLFIHCNLSLLKFRLWRNGVNASFFVHVMCNLGMPQRILVVKTAKATNCTPSCNPHYPRRRLEVWAQVKVNASPSFLSLFLVSGHVFREIISILVIILIFIGKHQPKSSFPKVEMT